MASRPAPAATLFPDLSGKTWNEVAGAAAQDPAHVVVPTGRVYEPGVNRFTFGLFEVDGTEIADGEIAIYAAPGDGGELHGPFPARITALQTEPAFRSRSVSEDPDPATVAYDSRIDLDEPGEWRLIAAVKDGESHETLLLPSIEVGRYGSIPDIGEQAPRIDTETAAEVGDISEIETRVPPDTMHELDAKETIGERPTVLLFATPTLCTSRVCGPVVDIAEQVKAETDAEVAFIHQEVYVDNDPAQGPRPQLRAFGLRTEPWLFVIDESGRVRTRIEGPFGAVDLSRALDQLGL